MKTEKEIKKQIKFCRSEIKAYKGFLQNAKPKEAKELKQLINDYQIEIFVLMWVIKSNNLPF